MAQFIDSVRIIARGGDGGAGVASFQKRKGKPRGKPNGGTGGRGGDVVLEASPDAASLLRYERQPHWKGERGMHGEGEMRHGKRGTELTLPVPLGTMVRDEDGTLLADLVVPGQRLTIAKGGRGGRGNAAFVTSERRAPSYSEQGEYGQERSVDLELKLIADAALIGYPNAGKSTLIAAVSAARPKIADYPFTTLEPNLGVVSLDDREFVLADIPGLIEGAAEGKGLGREFLRHTERARVLVFLLDPTSIQVDGPRTQLEVLARELDAYSSDLGSRPRVVVLSKIDAIPDVREHMSWSEEARVRLHPVSAVTGEGLPQLLHAVADLVDEAVREAPEREGFVLHRPLGDAFTVSRDPDGWIVEGRAAERAVNLDDLTLPEAADLAGKRLARIGVEDALRAAGALPGDDVKIGSLVFTFDPAAVVDEEESDAPGS
jgi:GTPase